MRPGLEQLRALSINWRRHPGVFWTEFPHENEEAWARARGYAPWWSKQIVTEGIDITNNTSGNATFEGSAAPYPIFVSTPEASEELAMA